MGNSARVTEWNTRRRVGRQAQIEESLCVPEVPPASLELYNANGAIMISNDDWTDDAASAALLSANGLAPQHPKESGIFTTLPPGPFTAILAGKNGGFGIGLIEIYYLK